MLLPEILINEARLLLTGSKNKIQANLVNFEVISELGSKIIRIYEIFTEITNS